MPAPKQRTAAIRTENQQWYQALLEDGSVKQAAIARLLGVTESAVSKWKRSGKIPAENIMAICRHCEVTPPSWLSLDGVVPLLTHATAKRINTAFCEGNLTTTDITVLDAVAMQLIESNLKIKALTGIQQQLKGE